MGHGVLGALEEVGGEIGFLARAVGGYGCSQVPRSRLKQGGDRARILLIF